MKKKDTEKERKAQKEAQTECGVGHFLETIFRVATRKNEKLIIVTEGNLSLALRPC